jgi:hypothetical protein
MLAYETVELMGHDREASGGPPEQTLKGRVPQAHQPRGIEEIVEIDGCQSVDLGRRAT